MEKKTFIIFSSLLILSSFILYSCYPDYGLAPSDFDTVLTLYDKSENFQKPTYAMPDTVVHLVEAGIPEKDIDRSNDDLILTTIVENMTKLGYERVPVDTTKPAPDFAILVAVTTTDNYGAVYHPGWGYWPGWGWWGGWRGWWHPGYVSTYKFYTGTIFIDLIDPLKINPDNQAYDAVWLARLNGLLASSNGGDRIRQRINDAFDQSPYLGAN